MGQGVMGSLLGRAVMLLSHCSPHNTLLSLPCYVCSGSRELSATEAKILGGAAFPQILLFFFFPLLELGYTINFFALFSVLSIKF